ncbi:hypothetical protein [Streptomyces ipomoeae]|uniref:hypothetical protein n=1 Tax=Streptomyces ipomoeae TaxID=103232 RepID=UPI0011476B9D|nr:hypothetical protein [Streptomyces ipomoeae]TQE33198.1 hypothetical protein Sipo7851_22160 [Streptomyces ipomoeae]
MKQLKPTAFEWESHTIAQAAKDLAEALAHIESLDPAREIRCHISLNTAPDQQEQEGADQ